MMKIYCQGACIFPPLSHWPLDIFKNPPLVLWMQICEHWIYHAVKKSLAAHHCPVIVKSLSYRLQSVSQVWKAEKATWTWNNTSVVKGYWWGEGKTVRGKSYGNEERSWHTLHKFKCYTCVWNKIWILLYILFFEFSFICFTHDWWICGFVAAASIRYTTCKHHSAVKYASHNPVSKFEYTTNIYL